MDAARVKNVAPKTSLFPYNRDPGNPLELNKLITLGFVDAGRNFLVAAPRLL
jgi:hypothetical protein